MREVVRGQFEGFKVHADDRKINKIFNDEAICETFGWDIFTLYKQPVRRRLEFSILIGERILMEKKRAEKSKNDLRSGRR